MDDIDRIPMAGDEEARFAAYRRKWAIELVVPNLGSEDAVAEAEKICRYIWPHQFKDPFFPEEMLGLSPELQAQRPELHAHLRRVLSQTLTEEMARWKNAG